MEDQQYHVEMRNIRRSFGGVKAVNDVNLRVKAGEIHALMGENGAGKSTLMKILAGAIEKDSGDIYIGGQPVHFEKPYDAILKGISVIYQEFALINDLTVAENIFIDKLTGEGKKFINWKELHKNSRDMLGKLGFSHIDVGMLVRELSVAHQQVVEICKAISRLVSVLVLDEPTSVLANNEVDQLFKLLIDLKNEGVAIIYISHRIPEIFAITDRITIMKDGMYVGTVNTVDVDDKQLVNMMVGRDMGHFFPTRVSDTGDTILEVRNINCGRQVQNISFDVKAGEVFGISGLVGAGRTETMMAVFGADRRQSGEVLLNGKPIKIKTPKDAVGNGIGLLPEDRKANGVLLGLTLRHNITLAALKICTNFLGWINRRVENQILKNMVEQLDIRMNSLEDTVSTLSGGNQQKIALAKLLASGCKVLLLDEPTRGVDVGAKLEIYKIINSLVAQKYAVVMVSSEMPEIIAMCDRVLVMREGKATGMLQRHELNEQNLIKYSMGVTN